MANILIAALKLLFIVYAKSCKQIKNLKKCIERRKKI